MRALILNSGMGSRMGVLASEHPKCMTEISHQETILSRQLRQLREAGIRDVIITTGRFADVLAQYCQEVEEELKITYVKNEEYEKTNYIYSIYCARKYLQDDILLIHGDMVFEDSILEEMLVCRESCMAVNPRMELPEKDFKAVVKDGYIKSVGIEFFWDAMAAWPLYKLNKADWKRWLENIVAYCENNRRTCYAENAFNEISDCCNVFPFDVGDRLCAEIDTYEDLVTVSALLKRIENRTVYMCFSTDVLHSGHIAMIKKATGLGKLILGVLSDEAVMSYKRYPLLPLGERMALFENIKGVYRVVKQETLSYRGNLQKYKPDYVVHGDDWQTGFQKPVRDEVVSVLAEYGGKLVEFPYAAGEKYRELENRTRKEISLPDFRRARLGKSLESNGFVTVLEAHSGLSGLIVENSAVYQDGMAKQFDAMWLSSLCDSTEKGKPDIELVDMTSRFRTIDDIMEVTTKPVIFDGNTGGQVEHFVYTVRTLERMGVSMVIIEDKTGLKKNSLFGTEVSQKQDNIENFCRKLEAGKRAQKTREFMICARIESLVLEKGMEDALSRAEAYVNAGADAIMIHSRKKEPEEIFEFIERFRDKDMITPLAVVPTSFHAVTEEEFRERGVNIVIYANQLTRAAVPAMQKAANAILEHHRAMECDENCMPFGEIIKLIPEDVV
ncbi:MAG: phosphoenolpyruvate mutase [Lachnospiraceae bacterium]